MNYTPNLMVNIKNSANCKEVRKLKRAKRTFFVVRTHEENYG